MTDQETLNNLPTDSIVLTPKQLSARWDLAEATLRNWRSAKKGVPYCKVGGKVVYRLNDVVAYEAKNLNTLQIKTPA
ncbi:MAG: hypothetical protein CMQ16_12445 [Gammaproteobacteria bacterium]|nr:hypothetical protein [Gammaproteobacteria bacterium]|tara:strand:+ start:698 stop:928 length:231 start_codon:yes stop_codon:yes gene_type:complete